LNEKVDYHFFQVILLFWLRQKVAQCTNYSVTQKKTVITKNRITSKILFRLTQNFSYF